MALIRQRFHFRLSTTHFVPGALVPSALKYACIAISAMLLPCCLAQYRFGLIIAL